MPGQCDSLEGLPPDDVESRQRATVTRDFGQRAETMAQSTEFQCLTSEKDDEE